eukprot:1138757-Pelagomonas_calceolata.AAC.2
MFLPWFLPREAINQGVSSFRFGTGIGLEWQQLERDTVMSQPAELVLPHLLGLVGLLLFKR